MRAWTRLNRLPRGAGVDSSLRSEWCEISLRAPRAPQLPQRSLVDQRHRHGAPNQIAEGDLLECGFDGPVDAEHETPRRARHANHAHGLSVLVGRLAFHQVPRSLEHIEELPERHRLLLAFE